MSIIAQLGEDKNIHSKYGIDSDYNIPKFEEIDPAIKETPEYCLNMARAGFSQLIRNRNILPVDAYNYIQTLRDYGSGNQDESYYINLFNESLSNTNNNLPSDTDGVWTKNKDSNRQALENINTKIISPITNLKMAIQGIMSQYDENLYINCIDSNSAKEEDMRMFGAMFDADMSEFTKNFEEQFGIPLISNKNFPKGITLDELMLYKDLGGFKSIYAIAIEEILKFTEKISCWDNVIKRKWIDDLLDLYWIVGRCKYDSEQDIEVWEYIDPMNFTIQYSQESDFNDAEYCGYFTLEKISKLDVLGFPRKKLIEAAQRWEYFWSNPKGIKWDTVIYDDKIGNFKVPVFHYNWIDVDILKSLKVTNKFDREAIYEIPFDKEVKKLSDYRKKQNIIQEEINTRVRRSYECSWVVDTDMIYDHGRIQNAPRKNKKTPMLNFFCWRGVTTNQNMIFGSIIESVIPFLDNLQLSWLKYQDALAKAHPGGYAINIRLLQNLQMDGQDITPFKAFEMFWKTGKFPYLDVPIGERYSGGAVLPITKIEGNLGELLAVTSSEINFNLQMIERLTGINPAPLGQTPDKDAPVSTTNAAIMGTNNVLRPLINGMYHLKEKLGDCTSRRVQLQIRNNEKARKSYEMIIGEFKTTQLKEAEALGVEYGLFPETRPDQLEINSLLQTAQISLSPGRDGNPQIDLSQYTYILEQVRSGGNIKKLSRDLAFLIRKNKEEIAKRQQENIQLQIQQQQQLEQQKAQNQAALNQQEIQKDVYLKQADTQGQMLIDNNKAKNDAQIRQMEANQEFKKMLYLQRDKAVQYEKEQQNKQVDRNQEYRNMLFSQREKLISNGK